MKNSQRMFALLVMAFVLLVASPVFASSLQEDVLYYVNVERAAAGLQPLAMSSGLNQAAATRAQEASASFAHRRPDGSEVKTVLNGADYSWFGENLAASQVMDAKRIVRAWMGSPTHRANVLNRHYTQMGVHCVQGSDGHYYWSQLFASN